MKKLDTLPPGLSPDGEAVDTGIPRNWMTTRLDYVVNWARRNSIWPMPFGTACCAGRGAYPPARTARPWSA